MNRMKTLATAATFSILTVACSGGKTDQTASVDSGPSQTTAGETASGVDYADLTGDASSGKSAFAQCRTCHVVDPGMNRVGPSLAGIVGREAGTVAGFNYSEANASSGITWTEENLFAFLENPQEVIPKTKMIYAGMPDAQKRADVIAYLKNPG